jgi:hypothetical protein
MFTTWRKACSDSRGAQLVTSEDIRLKNLDEIRRFRQFTAVALLLALFVIDSALALAQENIPQIPGAASPADRLARNCITCKNSCAALPVTYGNLKSVDAQTIRQRFASRRYPTVWFRVSFAQSPARPPIAIPVILPPASKPNSKLVASPRGKTNLTV